MALSKLLVNFCIEIYNSRHRQHLLCHCEKQLGEEDCTVQVLVLHDIYCVNGLWSVRLLGWF